MTLSDHPFFQSLSDLSTEELDKKQAELMNRFRLARSMNMQPEVMHQMDLMLNSIDAEKIKRQTIDDQPNGVVLDTDPIVIPKFNPNK